MNAGEAQRRLVAIAAAALFSSMMAIPAVYGGASHPESSYASSSDGHAPQPETVAVEIRECLKEAVGSSYVVNVPRETLLRLKAELRDASDLGHTFDLLREYGLLHDDLSRERIQQQYPAYYRSNGLRHPSVAHSRTVKRTMYWSTSTAT